MIGAAFTLGCLMAPLILLVGYYIILPAIMREGYRRSVSATQFVGVDGAQGAGSVDLAYYPLYYNVRRRDLVITGPAPKARHWQIGAFDGMTRLVPGAYLNQSTVELDDRGWFRARLTVSPEPRQGETVLDCSASPRGLVILRVLLAEERIELPSAELATVDRPS